MYKALNLLLRWGLWGGGRKDGGVVGGFNNKKHMALDLTELSVTQRVMCLFTITRKTDMNKYNTIHQLLWVHTVGNGFDF